MFTKYDKAIAALIMAFLTFVGTLTGFEGLANEQTVGMIMSVLTSLVVYAVPNKGAIYVDKK
jgi:hypothetical protein